MVCATRKIVSEYDQEISQSQTADNSWYREEEPRSHHETPGRQNKQSNQLSLAYQDDCKTRMDIKKRTTKHRAITDSHIGGNNKQKVLKPQRLKPSCAYKQSDQSHCNSLEYSMTVQLLTKLHFGLLSLAVDRTGSSESTLVKMPHNWKSHVTAQL